MSEDVEGPDTGTEASAGVDPAAVALALSGASREEADRFLRKQSALIEDQRRLAAEQLHHLHEQFKSLRLTIWEKRAGVMLRIATVFAGLAVACFLGAVLWDAAHDDSVVIEAFSVPPDLAARGLTGQIVAEKLLGDLSTFQAETRSLRSPSSYANNWDNELKVEIPETGVSIGEFDRFLRAWLGHQTHIAGAVYRTAAGIAVTAGAAGDASRTFEGTDADLDQLLLKSAEVIYRTSQPLRYGSYMTAAQRFKEAESAYDSIIADGSPSDRAWAYVGLAHMYGVQGYYAKERQAEYRAISLRPDFAYAFNYLTLVNEFDARDEDALAAARATIAASQKGRDPDLTRQAWDAERLGAQGRLAEFQGDYKSEIEFAQEARLLPRNFFAQYGWIAQLTTGLARSHDASGLAAAKADLPTIGPDTAFPAVDAISDLALGRWTTILDQRASLEADIVKTHPPLWARIYFTKRLWPVVALASALSGDFAAAHGLIDKTPLDCSLCLRTRGRIDALEKNWAGADYWFRRAVRDAPSVPFAYADWGQMLLEKGDADAAIAQFRLANQKGPHFADPLEGWGEALMAKNQSHLALAKFAEAEKYAPNWGRLHLKWGEALFYAGKKDDAQKQFARAAQLDLTPSEKGELAGMNHG